MVDVRIISPNFAYLFINDLSISTEVNQRANSASTWDSPRFPSVFALFTDVLSPDFPHPAANTGIDAIPGSFSCNQDLILSEPALLLFA
jgi:hypothetical protein